MTIGRRGFLLAGSAVAGAGMLPVSEAMAAPVMGGRSVAEFGVEPDKDADQTQALQRAIDELSRDRQAIVFPGGSFLATRLKLPPACTIAGTPGLTMLTAEEIAVLPSADAAAGKVNIAGMVLAQSKASQAQAFFSSAAGVNISNTAFIGTAKISASLGPSPSILQSVSFLSGGLKSACEHLTVAHCQFAQCDIAILTQTGGTSTISSNRFADCGTAVDMRGEGVVSGNIVVRSRQFGLRLGAAEGAGNILAQGNILQNCRIALGVASSGHDIFASLNMIKGAKDGAIRAFDGDRLVGPDLSQKSAESYLNLTVAGNVVR